MALLIPNLNLPKGCGDCLFTTEDKENRSWCLIDPCLWIDGYECIRHKDCPLQEIQIGIDLVKGKDFTSYINSNFNREVI